MSEFAPMDSPDQGMRIEGTLTDTDLGTEIAAIEEELSQMVIDPENPDTQETYDALAEQLARLQDMEASLSK